jgi:hypothetical protein
MSTEELTTLVVLILWLLYIIALYKQSESSSPSQVASAFGKFIDAPSWSNFKCFYAALANDPLGDIMSTIILGLLPLPGLSEATTGQKIEFILAKIGVYKISLALLLGSPNYPVKC